MKTTITSNVLEDISKRLNGGGSNGKDNALILFNGSIKNIDKKLALLSQLKEKYNLSVGFSFVAERMLDTNKIINRLSPLRVYKEEDLFILQSIVRDNKVLISPNITVNTLSKVSLGLIDSFIPNIIWTFLYDGKDVYLDFEAIRNFLGKKTENKFIEKQEEDRIKTILSMGAKEISDESFLSLLMKDIDSPLTNKTSPATISSRKKLLTESDLVSSNSNTTLVVERGTIVTPLARDKAREKNIKIEFK